MNYFNDNLASHVFTADHGMSDKGSHGDGHPSNTDTPLVVWGAGVGWPVPISEEHHPDDAVRFVDEHVHDMPTPPEWGLGGLERLDVNQADIAPLMSTLLGLPCPVNSVGNLPLGYINLSEVEEVEAVLANTKQILHQFLRKSQLKQANSLLFKPLKPLANYILVLNQIEHLISTRDYKSAKKLSEDLRSLAIGWMAVISLGYIGWMIYLILHVLKSYTASPESFFGKERSVYLRKNTWKVYFSGCLLMGAVFMLLFMEHSPPLYHAYFAMTIFLWIQISCEYQFIKALWKYVYRRETGHLVKLVASFVISVLVLEILVKSFTDRQLYTWIFVLVGVIASVYLLYSIPWKSGIPIFVWLACWFLSIFTFMPAEIHTKLVVLSGLMILIIGGVTRYMHMYAGDSKYWLSLTHGMKKSKFPLLFLLQTVLVVFSSIMVHLSASCRTEKQKLLALHQLINWSISGVSTIDGSSAFFGVW